MKDINQQAKQPSTLGLAIGGPIFICLGLGAVAFAIWSIFKGAGLSNMARVPAAIVILLIGLALLAKGFVVVIQFKNRLSSVKMTKTDAIDR